MGEEFPSLDLTTAFALIEHFRAPERIVLGHLLFYSYLGVLSGCDSVPYSVAIRNAGDSSASGARVCAWRKL